MNLRKISLGRFLLVCCACTISGAQLGILFWGGLENYMGPALGTVVAIPVALGVWVNAPPAAATPERATGGGVETGASREGF